MGRLNHGHGDGIFSYTLHSKTQADALDTKRRLISLTMMRNSVESRGQHSQQSTYNELSFFINGTHAFIAYEAPRRDRKLYTNPIPCTAASA
jgi:hypothetical protein